MFADEVLGEAAEVRDGTLQVAIEQASLGGDLVGAVDMTLAAKDGVLTIGRLKAVLPGKNSIETSGRLTRGEFGPVFAGPVKVEGSGLRPLTRWAAGDRDMSGQASIGDFTFTANASIGDGELNLADATGELSGTKFRGNLRLHGGERPLIEVNLDSDRLDLRELMGEGSLRQFWTPASASSEAGAADKSLFAELPDNDLRVTLRVGELLLPNIPPGKLDARFALQSGTLDVEQLDFAASSTLALNGKGRIEHLHDKPSGRVDFALQAANADSLRIVADLFGLPEGVSRSMHLSTLAPMNVRVSLVAAREGELTNASIELGGKAGTSDVSLVARALGDPTKPGEAKIDVDGKVIGEKPQAFLVLLFPDLPLERIVTPAGSQGRLIVKLSGVPNSKVTGQAALETAPIEVAFVGQGSLQPDGLALAGKGAVVSRDASAALTLLGFEAPPSAANIPLSLKLDLTKQASAIDLAGINGSIAGETVAGSARFDLGRRQDALRPFGERRQHIAAVSAWRAGGVASHAVDRGDARRDRRGRLGGLARARLLARSDRAGRRTDQSQGQHAVPRLRREGARRHVDRCRRQGRALRHRSQRPSVRRQLGCFRQPRAARQWCRARRARRSERRQAGGFF